jgi:hypothetical protein
LRPAAGATRSDQRSAHHPAFELNCAALLIARLLLVAKHVVRGLGLLHRGLVYNRFGNARCRDRYFIERKHFNVAFVAQPASVGFHRHQDLRAEFAVVNAVARTRFASNGRFIRIHAKGFAESAERL